MDDRINRRIEFSIEVQWFNAVIQEQILLNQ